MKKLFVLIPILFIMFACGPEKPTIRIEYERYCSTPEQQACFGNHFIGCASAANPKSDEEPEDWLPQCKEAAREACCPLIKGVAYFYNYKRHWIPWSEVSKEHKTILNERG